MKMKKLFYNKTAKGIVSLITIVILLSSILASSIFYGNNITANAVKEGSSAESTGITITEINDVKVLNPEQKNGLEKISGF